MNLVGRGGWGGHIEMSMQVDRYQAQGIRDVDCRIIWLHTPGIHVRFFCVHIIVIFFGADTSKAQRASLGDKFDGLLRALNIMYSMFIQIGHDVYDVVIITHKGGLSSLVPPSPLCISCCF